MEPYRERLIETYKYLLDVHSETMNHIVNLAMAGELKEIDESFEAGDIFQFDIDHFKDTNDTNLNMLIDFHENLNDMMVSIGNINALKEEELDLE